MAWVQRRSLTLITSLLRQGKKFPFPFLKKLTLGKKKGLARVQDHPDNCWALAISVCKNLPLFEDYGTEQRTALQWTV
jgi:hypothetical protein